MSETDTKVKRAKRPSKVYGAVYCRMPPTSSLWQYLQTSPSRGTTLAAMGESFLKIKRAFDEGFEDPVPTIKKVVEDFEALMKKIEGLQRAKTEMTDYYFS
ncbi:MAG: hypothetical protein M0R66_03955 [Candidatus Omnitrophica bacterium]|nr:hypothetical protein [Candidatus Omnitrophota bacterium]